MREKRMKPRIWQTVIVGGLLLAGPTLPANAASDEIERELKRMGLSREHFGGIPETMRTPPNAREPALAAALTFAAPIGIATFCSSQRLDPLMFGLTLTPLSLGMGHAYAGDPARGGWVVLGLPVAMLGSYFLGGMIGRAVLPDSGTGFSDTNDIMLGLMTAAAGTLAYWGWAIYDSYETANRTNAEARKQQGQQPAER